MLTPIRPSDIKIQKVFPDEVISAANELLIKNSRKFGPITRATFTRKEFVDLIKTKNSQITEQYLMLHNFLDIETIFEDYGWKVYYEQACMGETHYEPFFKFESKP